MTQSINKERICCVNLECAGPPAFMLCWVQPLESDAAQSYVLTLLSEVGRQTSSHLSLLGESEEGLWSSFHLTVGEVKGAALSGPLQNTPLLLNRLDLSIWMISKQWDDNGLCLVTCCTVSRPWLLHARVAYFWGCTSKYRGGDVSVCCKEMYHYKRNSLNPKTVFTLCISKCELTEQVIDIFEVSLKSI